MPPRRSKRTFGETGQHGSQPALRSQRSSRGRGAAQRGRGGAQRQASPPRTDSVQSSATQQWPPVQRGADRSLTEHDISTIVRPVLDVLPDLQNNGASTSGQPRASSEFNSFTSQVEESSSSQQRATRRQTESESILVTPRTSENPPTKRRRVEGPVQTAPSATTVREA